jgi:hypothetical protein
MTEIVSMFRTTVIAAIFIVSIAAAGFAQPARFDGEPLVDAYDGVLTVSGNIVGLNRGDVRVEVTATAIISCMNKSGNGSKGYKGEQTVKARAASRISGEGEVHFMLHTRPINARCARNMAPDIRFEEISITVHQAGRVILRRVM